MKIITRLENLEAKAKKGETVPQFVLLYRYSDHFEDQHHRRLLPEDAKAIQESIRPFDLLLILESKDEEK